MIDIHVHILPGFDDGAADIQTAVDMAEMAVAGGTHTVIATPHVMGGVSFYTAENIVTAVSDLNLLLAEKRIPLTVLPGAEYYLEPDLPSRLKAGELLTLNFSQYLLVELPVVQVPAYINQVFYELQINGITPIIAHPERNSGFINEPKLLEELVMQGNLTQITSGSIKGVFGHTVKKTALYFLQQGWGHVVASDAHSLTNRPPVLYPVARELTKLGGESYSQMLLADNPLSISEGRPVQSPPLVKSKRLFFFRF